MNMKWKIVKGPNNQSPSAMSLSRSKGNQDIMLSVGFKLFVLIFASIILSVSVTGIVTLRVAKHIIEENAAQAAYETIQQTNEKLDTVLGVYEQMMLQMITNTNLHNWLFTANDQNRQTFDQLSARNQVQEYINQIAFSNSLIANIMIIPKNPEHLTFSTLSSTSVSIDYEAPWFQEASSSQDNLWLHTRIGGYSNAQQRPLLGLARLMKTSLNQEFVVLFEINQEMLNQQVRGIQLSESSRVYITNTQNLLLQADDESLILAEAELAIPEGNRGIMRNEEGEEFIVVADFSQKARWYVVGIAPVSELTEDTKVVERVIYLIVGGAAIVAIALSILVARTMGGPLRRLQRLMVEGAKGNLNVRTSFKNRDEIGQVGRSFNEMMEQITVLVQQTNRSAAEVLATAQELSHSAKDTAHSAREISEATEQIANGAATLASEAERGNELVIDLSKQLQQVVEANRTMGEVAADVHKVSEQGTGYMVQLNDKTRVTEEITRRMVEKVDQLKESTASIRGLLDMLTQITQQTNILALNASIEASRSGAAGRGFMVIAGEIRKLADQSRQSIDVVAEMTEHIQGGIAETVSVMSEAYPLFQEQISAVRDADMIFNRVRERMTGLVQQADKVTEAIEQLEKAQKVLSDTMASVSAVSEESSAISEEVASSSAAQLNTSDALVNLVGKLETLSHALTDSLKKFKM